MDSELNLDFLFYLAVGASVLILALAIGCSLYRRFHSQVVSK